MLRMLDVLKVAVSEKPLGTVAGVQLEDEFQLPLLGAAFHAALPALLVRGMRNESAMAR